MGGKRWTVEVYREGDRLEWFTFRIVGDTKLLLESGFADVVSDAMREAGGVLESDLPEWFT